MNQSSVQKKLNIIDNHTLALLNNIQNKVLKSVVCYLWINQINPKQTIDVIDAIELIFENDEKIILSGNESQEGLCAIEYNFDEQKEFIEKEFQGKIRVFRVNASQTEMWKEVIDKKLIQVRLTKDKNTNQYLCDEMIFEFENKEMRLIQVHPLDGIILDYYEEI
ncbi:MAG: hypothetical protein OHK0036_01330 [Bacteroidia bacterium]